MVLGGARRLQGRVSARGTQSVRAGTRRRAATDGDGWGPGAARRLAISSSALPLLELILRILLGTGLGAAIGFERDLHGRPAGLRTHAIVSLASATFMVVSTRFVFYQRYAPGDLIAVDASRIAASVVSGIGFLGAGAILRTGFTVRGLTTAASLWLVAAIGMAAGGGMYVVAIFVTALGLATLTLLRRFEDRGEPIARQRITVVLDEKLSSISKIVESLAGSGAKVSEEEYERLPGGGGTRMTFEVRTVTPLQSRDLVRSIEHEAGVQQIKVERL
jgi:putative Mg2+ transporter-C (MgtC) family protein